LDSIIVLRLAERILAVAIGGLTIYLGYRLFLAIPNSVDSEGRFKLPWNTSIVLSRIGPGVFFALFGSIVVGSSFFRSITYNQPPPSRKEAGTEAAAPAAQSSAVFIGAGSTLARSDARNDAQMLLRRDIAVLNTIPNHLNLQITPENRSMITLAIPRIKLSLMEGVWTASWGDQDAFRRWIESNEAKVPVGLEKAAEYFWNGPRAKP
jgi:hypothetical protein